MPNDKVLEQKKAMVEEMSQKLSQAAAGVFVDYRGLTVEEDTKLRNELRAAGVEYKVVKNSILKFAAEQQGLNELDPFLNGPTAVALCESDAVAPAKVLSKFAKDIEALEIKTGFVDGKVIGLDEIKALADLPSKEVLVAKALGGLNAPISGFVNVLNANLRGLAIVLNAIAEQKSA